MASGSRAGSPPAPRPAATDAAADLRAWAGRRRRRLEDLRVGRPAKGKNKAMPKALEGVLARLTGQAGPPYAGAAELLEDLNRVSGEAPANATA